MAFSPKTDYTGLSTVFTTQLGIRDDAPNQSNSTYEPEGQDGALLAVEAYGENASPTNNFALKSAITATAGQLALGKLVSITTGSGQSAVTKKFRLKSVKIGTKANGPVTISASSELVEDDATDVATNNFPVPAFSLDTAHLAQILFSAFTVGGQGANLISADYEIGLDISKDTLVGVIISNGAGKASITASGSILVKGDVIPTVTPGEGWTLSQKLTCQNPETSYRTFTFAVKIPLAKAVAQQSNG